MADRVAASETEPPNKPQFVHLHNHSHYSLLDGLQKVPEMLDRVKELNMTAVGLTDHGTLSGAIEFYKECKKRDLKPIVGVETYVAPRLHTDKAGRQDMNPYHLVLLAENMTGYHNLIKLVTIAQLEGFYAKPRIDRELIEKYHEGLIALSGCAGGELAERLREGNLNEAENVARWYDETFGRGNYFLELQAHEHQWDVQKELNDALIGLSQKTGIPTVVTADSHYARHENRDAHETLLCVQTGKNLSDTNRMTMSMDLYLTSPEEIAERFARVPEAYENTVKIAERCHIEFEFGKILIPTFPVPEVGLSEGEYLHKLCWQGLVYRYLGVPRDQIHDITEVKARAMLPPEVVTRIEYEFSIIGRMGYDGYMLIVADFINWGKNQGIIFGPGRGSAAGSIVSYAMNITDLDPLKYDLLFERFLNPDRVSMPDIDVDIQDSRRGEVIDYVIEKYGKERVAQIITFGTMAAKSAVRDTGRVLGYPLSEVDFLAKLIPDPVQGRHVPLAVLLGLKKGKEPADQELSAEYQSNVRSKQLLDLAMQLEGTIRSNGVHAAGVVIAPEIIDDYVPLQRAQKGLPCTQFPMGQIEDLGLLKFDFLGLSNLTIINNALVTIKRVYGQHIDLPNLPLDDAKAFELLSQADTTGVFQLESAGMKRYLRDLKPTTFDDIIAMCALYRPGPMQFIDDFIDRKHGRKEIVYFHPTMENALKNTYGILVYQEQVMQIAKEMCGFTGGQADTLRKGVAKKKPEVLAKMKVEFIEGAIKTSGADPAKLEEFWTQLEAFAAYCFPKAHAACYAMIAYQTAYLKAHYPSAFMAALMTSDYGNIDRIAIEISECRHMGLTILPPDVNESFGEFAVVPETGHIRFGLSAIKNIGTGPIEAIVAAREEGGQFMSIEDFAKRVSAKDCNRKAWESLIKCGAFDEIGDGDRARLLHNLDLITAFAAKAQKSALSGQIDIFGSLNIEEAMPGLRLELPSAPATEQEKLAWEKELLGLYISSHPLDEHQDWLEKHCRPISNVTPAQDGRTLTVGGIIISVRKITTKKGDPMAFVALEDKTGSTELIVFPKAFALTPNLFETDRLIVATGKVTARDRENRLISDAKIMVDTVKAVGARDVPVLPRPAGGGFSPSSEAPAPRPTVAPPPVPHGFTTRAGDPAAGSLTLSLVDPSDQDLLFKIKGLLNDFPGDTQVYALLGADGAKKIRLPFCIDPTVELLDKLRSTLGEPSVAFRPTPLAA